MTGLRVLLSGLAVAALLTGCAAPRSPMAGSQANHWQGRLSLRIDSEPVQSLSAGFELLGTESSGELTLFTPLGSTAAVLTWTPEAATLASQGEVKKFPSFKAMVRHAVGADLPVAAVFSWLAGRPAEDAEWSADLSGHPQRITARRASPGPVTELRLIMNQP